MTDLPPYSGSVTAISRDTDGNLIAGTSSDGLYMIAADGTCVKIFETHDDICSIFHDSKGNTLIGLKENGITYITGDYRFTYLLSGCNF